MLNYFKIIFFYIGFKKNFYQPQKYTYIYTISTRKLFLKSEDVKIFKFATYIERFGPKTQEAAVTTCLSDIRVPLQEVPTLTWKNNSYPISLYEYFKYFKGQVFIKFYAR